MLVGGWNKALDMVWAVTIVYFIFSTSVETKKQQQQQNKKW